jgi:HlyD family secretion protein
VSKRTWLVVSPLPLLLALAGYGAVRLYRAARTSDPVGIPTAAVQRGEVVFNVTAKGELTGGNSQMYSAPMVGGSALTLTSLRESGELVKEGDVVAQFDTTEQEFNLKEAEADVAQAEQQVLQAQAESQAKEEEARDALAQARADLRVAELETRRNELLPAIEARENELAAAAARERVQQLEKDLGDRIATAQAGTAIQEAARAKAGVATATARRNIESMTLRAKAAGYVARQQNTQGNFQWGSYLPPVQVGDTVRAGMGVAQIPDLANWEVTARMGELDRGHLAERQQAGISVVALPGRAFHGHVKVISGTTGLPWDRHFDCRVAIDDPSPELRPGMSALVVITTEIMKNVLWLRSQALFESGSRKFVYARSRDGFTPVDVKLVRRSESQAVIEGLAEGQVVALASPEMMKKQPSRLGGAAEAIPK